jgi:hypothetical protein
MAANKLINFRCPDDLLTAIEAYGRQHYPSAPNGRGNVDFDQSKALRDILISGLETLTNGEVKIEREPVKQSNKSDNSPYITELLDRITKLESQNHAVQQTPAIDPNIEARLNAMESALSGKSYPSQPNLTL